MLNRYLAPPLIFGLICLLSVTLRRVVVGSEHQEATSGTPHMVATWHDMLLYIPWYYRATAHTYRPLASPSNDGEVVTRVMGLFGFSIIRGSSYQQAKSSLREMTRAVKEGQSLGIVVDGSRGPRHEAQEGAVMMAKLTGIPIAPVVINFSSCWRAKSWDRFMIPKPFSQVVVIHGAPVMYDEEGGREETMKLFAEQMRTITAQAEGYFGA